MKLATECGTTIYKGFFDDGDDCGERIEVDIPDDEKDEYLRPIKNDPGNFYMSFGVKCPRCGATLEWPQVWTPVEE